MLRKAPASAAEAPETEVCAWRKDFLASVYYLLSPGNSSISMRWKRMTAGAGRRHKSKDSIPGSGKQHG
jgi:hypothetical protein